MSFQLRPARREDAAGIAAVVNELSHALYGEPEVGEDEVRQWFGLPGVEPFVAVTSGGTVAGYADVSVEAEQRRFWIYLRVPPGEGAQHVARALLDLAETRAAGGTAKAFIPSVYEFGIALLVERGYELARYSFHMRADVGGELEAPGWPQGIAVRTFVSGRDDEAVYEAHQESFADQFEFVRQPYEEWRRSVFFEPHDPSLWFLAEDGDELAGICLCRSEWAGDPDLGWVAILGVRRPWRRRGLGLALLRHAFSELRARGRLRVGLGVDGLSATGAVRLYERAGMRVARRYDQYQKSIPA